MLGVPKKKFRKIRDFFFIFFFARKFFDPKFFLGFFFFTNFCWPPIFYNIFFTIFFVGKFFLKYKTGFLLLLLLLLSHKFSRPPIKHRKRPKMTKVFSNCWRGSCWEYPKQISEKYEIFFVAQFYIYIF